VLLWGHVNERTSKITIQDVAERAGVGVGTVSRVLNNHPSVRPATRARIMGAMDELGYTPNPHARRVAGGRSYTVSVTLPAVSTEFYVRLLDGIERALAAHRYDSALFPILSRERLTRYLSSNTLPYQADGLVLATHNLTELFAERKLPGGQPVVLVDVYSPDHDSAHLNNYLGGELAARHLAAFPGPIFALEVYQGLDEVFSSTVFAERLAGFRETLLALGRPFAADQALQISFSPDDARLAARQIIARAGKLAPGESLNIFAGADLLALAVLEEAERAGLCPGENLRLVGFDDHSWAAQRGLTTLHQPIEAMGAAAAELLIDRIEGFSGPARSVRFEPHLLARRSTLGP
jgi:LacI family transcriptional regulator